LSLGNCEPLMMFKFRGMITKVVEVYATEVMQIIRLLKVLFEVSLVLLIVIQRGLILLLIFLNRQLKL